MTEVVTLGIFKLREDAFVPKYSHIGDSGMEMRIPNSIRIYPGETVVVPLGWACRIPEGYEIQIRSRSGMSTDNPDAIGTKGSGIVVAQGIGTIDSNYRGEVGVILYNRGYKGIMNLQRGDNVAQAVLCEIPDVSIVELDEFDDSETTRGTGGYGSTDGVSNDK